MKATIMDPAAMNYKIHRDSLRDFDEFVANVHSDLEKKGLLSVIVEKAKDTLSTYVGSKFEDALYDAQSPDTSDERFKELSTYPSETVRRALVDNTKVAFPTLLNMLRDDKNKSFLRAVDVATHPTTPDDWMVRLIKEIDNDLELGELLFRDNLPVRALEILAYERNGNYRSMVEGHVDVQQEAKEMLMERLDVLRSQEVDDETLKITAIKSQSKTELYSVALNKNASLDTLNIVDAKLLSYGVDIIDVLEAGEVQNVKISRKREQESNPEIKSVIEAYGDHVPGDTPSAAKTNNN